MRLGRTLADGDSHIGWWQRCCTSLQVGAPRVTFAIVAVEPSCGTFEPVECEVGHRGGGVVGDVMRCVVDVGELDAIGVPLRIAADRPHELLGPGAVAATEYDEGRN